MYPDDYIDGYEQRGETTCNNGVLHAEIFSTIDKAVCPYCGSSNTKKNDFRIRTIEDENTEGKPVHITVHIRRFLCNDCKARKKEGAEVGHTTFSADPPAKLDKNAKIDEEIIQAIIQKVARERVTIDEAARSLHVSPASASAIISKRREKALKEVATLMPPDVLIVYPFEFGGAERGAIIGVCDVHDEHNKGPKTRALLYTILEDCQASSVNEFLKKVSFEGGYNPKISLTDYPRPNLYNSLGQLYENSDVGILRESTLIRIRTLSSQWCQQELIAARDFALYDLGEIFTTNFYDEENDEYFCIDLGNDDFYEYLAEHNIDFEDYSPKLFMRRIENWWNSLSVELQPFFKPLYDEILHNKERVLVGIKYLHRKYDPATLLQYIEKLKTRIEFKDLMSWLTMAADVYNKEHIKVSELLSSSYVPTPLHCFYIDLTEFNESLGLDI